MIRKVLVIGESGTGKALKNTEPVITPKGWVKIGDIKEGDIVFDEMGEKTKVLKTHKYRETVFRVHFDDNTYIDTCKDHKWKIGKFSHGEYKFCVMTTSELKEKIEKRKNEGIKYNRYFIPTTRPVKFDKNKLIVDPYLLGVLLGDGCLTKLNRLYISTTENDILNKVNNILKRDYSNLIFNKNKSSKCQYILQYTDELSISLGRGRRETKELINDLDYLGLVGTNSHSKFIPEEYLMSDINDRIELLKGIFDTDGHVQGTRKSISTVSERLKNNIVELANSLGIITIVKQDNRENKNCYYISLFTDDKIWSSKKHESRFEYGLMNKKSTRQTNKNRIYITNIEILDEISDMTCLEVESEYHTFLTKGYKVTHNSTSMRNLNPQETVILKCLDKELPFKTKFKCINVENAQMLIKYMQSFANNEKVKNIIIEDFIYLSVKSFFNKAKDKGYEKFMDLAVDVYSSLMCLENKNIITRKENNDLNVIFITQSERDEGKSKVRSIGKAVDTKLKMEGLFSIVLESTVTNGEYEFKTHNCDDDSVCKSPMGMFENDYIPNDLKYVIEGMDKYYNED